MLVLSRNKDEYVCIGENCEYKVMIVDVRGDTVRLGFDVPKDIPVHRSEVYDAIKRGEVGEKAENDINRMKKGNQE